MSYGRLVDKEERVEAELAALEAKAAALLADAEATDTAEDEKFGPDGKDVDLPAELDRREKRLARLQAARAQIEAEAAERGRKHAETPSGADKTASAPTIPRPSRPPAAPPPMRPARRTRRRPTSPTPPRGS
jgi:hypothetical protein